MTDDDRILTRHPEGKQGVRIARPLYDTMRAALLAVIPDDAAGVEFRELPQRVEPLLDAEVFGDASVMWYVTTVKQDLEARGLIEQVPRARPQRLRRATARG